MATSSCFPAAADTLLDLLIAQCEDLEALLALSRSETAAVEGRDFEELMRITAQRATLGERLEVYHRQIAEMRERLGVAAEGVLQSPTAMRITELVNSVQAQDYQTQPLLLAVRREMEKEQAHLNQMRRGLTAYLNEGRMPAVACDQLA
jgi:flagellar biosynthesis/type III secretory pathway chaperone